MLDAINFIEQSKNSDIQQNLIDKALNLVDTITPDMDDFGSGELGSYALNACVAIYNSIQFLADKQHR